MRRSHVSFAMGVKMRRDSSPACWTPKSRSLALLGWKTPPYSWPVTKGGRRGAKPPPRKFFALPGQLCWR